MSDTTGRAKGGEARANALSSKQRKTIAKMAAASRWDSSIPVATHIGELKIGDLVLPCAVLPDGTRVLSQGGITTAFGPAIGGRQLQKRALSGDAESLPTFLVADSLKEFIPDSLRTLVATPIKYRDPRGGPVRIGLDASLLPQVCEVWLRARDAKALMKIQFPVADRADILMRGLAHTGIIALVDEVTGYQRDRAKDALAKILEAFIERELQPWVQTFPADYYEELFRLRGLEYPTASVKRPQYFGVLTNDIVYKRLAPGVLEELKRVTPKNDAGRPKNKFFQRLTTNIGYPKLREHLGAVVAIMKLSDDWNGFREKLDRFYPRHDELQLTGRHDADRHDDDDDDGKGL